MQSEVSLDGWAWGRRPRTVTEKKRHSGAQGYREKPAGAADCKPGLLKEADLVRKLVWKTVIQRYGFRLLMSHIACMMK